ncbi:desulfoferrodoxin FeS4 iron-binding domain-containing protein [Methanococcoides sp. SA1]|nr:desulfoferrodoxin FeS4 iron-binding domain-containing protein [Methanococcoides sp. SA1]
MTKRGQIWKCEVCGNIVEVLHEGADSLVCCGKPMVLQKEKNEEEGLTEKHMPVIEGKIVRVGSVLHPMTEEHYIEWVEATGRDGEVVKKFLVAEDESIVEFCFDVVKARCYCNLHGLWKDN